MVKRVRERSHRGERNREKEQTHEDGARVMHIETSRGRAKKKKEREREREREKREAQKTGEPRTGSRCRILQQQHREGQGRWKMVSVRGELTVAYNLMFSILDSFSMGNSLAPVWA